MSNFYRIWQKEVTCCDGLTIGLICAVIRNLHVFLALAEYNSTSVEPAFNDKARGMALLFP